MVSITGIRPTALGRKRANAAAPIRVKYRVPEWAKNAAAFALLMAIGLALVIIAVDGIRIP